MRKKPVLTFVFLACLAASGVTASHARAHSARLTRVVNFMQLAKNKCYVMVCSDDLSTCVSKQVTCPAQ